MSGLRTIERDWECSLSLSPKRVLSVDTVTMTVTLSARGGRDLTFQDYQAFNFQFSTDHPRLTTAARGPNPVATHNQGGTVQPVAPGALVFQFVATPFPIPDLPDGNYQLTVLVRPVNPNTPNPLPNFPPFPADGISGEAILTSVTHETTGPSAVTLQRTGTYPTRDQLLWVAIRNRTSALDFTRYQNFIDISLCGNELDISAHPNLLGGRPAGTLLDENRNRFPTGRELSILGPHAYTILKLATEVFLTLESGIVTRDGNVIDIDKERIRLENPSVNIENLASRLKNYLISFDGNPVVLPYLDRIVGNLVSLDRNDIQEVLPYCFGILQHRLTAPSLLELIWSYWHEEGMLIQTMHAIGLRFQNRRGSRQDPLVELELDPLRPLNNLIWGFVQDEHNRLTVPRRASEYHHHYGLSLVGRATAGLIPADDRSRFIEAFHNLLYRTALFYKEDADTTIIAEAFPLLNALKEVHLLLAEGAHNQFGDLPWTARVEMLTMQWLLARPEMREFLRGRYMVPYQEGWMGAVDSMKRLQGWTDTTITHFHELAVTGERILLSIRYGDWVDIENIQEQAKNWARYWKPEIQRYIHGYQAVTGVDLMADVVDSRDAAIRYVQPSALLARRLAQQTAATSLSADGTRMALPAPQPAAAITSRVPGSAQLPRTNQRRLPRIRAGE
jgi:hypothetical protein